MKKKIISFIFALSLLLCFMLPAFAADSRFVIDEAELLSDSEEEALAAHIEELRAKYDFDIVILTVNDTGNYTPESFADDYYDYNGYNNNGMLFLLSMENRDWYISTKGYGITAFTDYGISYIGDDVVSYFSDGDYAEGFEQFLNDADSFIDSANKGEAVDSNNAPSDGSEKVVGIVIVLIIALLGAGITVMVMRSSMKTARPQHEAGNYIRNGSFNITGQRDMFLYSTVSKTPRAEQNSGGGSSTHIGSSGSSHGGGGGHF